MSKREVTVIEANCAGTGWRVDQVTANDFADGYVEYLNKIDAPHTSYRIVRYVPAKPKKRVKR
jgi:hypothetical protein